MAKFQVAYGSAVMRRDIFRMSTPSCSTRSIARYAENLKRELPRIPLLPDPAAFQTCVEIGEKLAVLYLTYEQASEYPLERVMRQDIPPDYHVEKMQLTPAMTALVYNDWLALTGIPPACFEYRLGKRSALE